MSKISKAIDLLKTKYKMAMKQKVYQGEKYKLPIVGDFAEKETK